MAREIILKPSRTLAEFRLLPGLTSRRTAIDAVSLRTPLAIMGERRVELGIPLVAAAMQSVSGVGMGVELARHGGAAFLFCSQPAEEQAAMVAAVKAAGVESPQAACGADGRLLAVAALNTHDHQQRAPLLVGAGADVLAVDASDGHSVYQQEALSWLAMRFPHIPVIGGNIITAEGFRFLTDAGAAAVKVGMGGGSICITQEQKGTGRGLATAVMEVCAARDALHQQTGRYVPIIADGGIGTAKDMVVALALGADGVMLGRYFAAMDESPMNPVRVDGRTLKPYWGEGSAQAQQWKEARYHHGSFVEGVSGFVDQAGPLAGNLPQTLAKLRAAMSSCGVATIAELHQQARLELVSALSIREGGVHDIHLPGAGPSATGGGSHP